MSSSGGSRQPVIFSAAFTTLCFAFCLPPSSLHTTLRCSRWGWTQYLLCRQQSSASSPCYFSWGISGSKVSGKPSSLWRRCWLSRRGPQIDEHRGMWRTALVPHMPHLCRAGLGLSHTSGVQNQVVHQTPHWQTECVTNKQHEMPGCKYFGSKVFSYSHQHQHEQKHGNMNLRNSFTQLTSL